jgi:hypothetical protein
MPLRIISAKIDPILQHSIRIYSPVHLSLPEQKELLKIVEDYCKQKLAKAEVTID